ncbi:ABC transporter permease [Candidatus Kaiserbacteria bacterium]|nr:ABC transporter permease [Candidatus Kaiserbacteria bacterium]
MSVWINMKRVARYGLAGFVRNGFVSLAAVLVMVVTLFMIANILLSNAAMKATLHELTNQVDVRVYFTAAATPDQIGEVQRSLEALPEVLKVTYETREQALAAFRERHKNDQLTTQALDELGENPFGASLEIKAKETSQYEGIANYLTQLQGGGTDAGRAIDTINFYQNKTAIDRLTDIIATSKTNDIAKAVGLAVVSLLIAFNTIRLAIYTARDEIGVMNLVGAGHWYVRGPFMVGGVLYGVVSGIIVLLLLYPILIFYPVLIGLGPTSELLFGSFSSFDYYTSHFVLFFFVLMGIGIVLGALSSYLAVRRYLRA